MRVHILLCLFGCLILQPTVQAQGIDDPHDIVAALRDRLYSIGESSPEFGAFVAAEQHAAIAMQRAILSAPETVATRRGDRQRTPLMSAALNGYPGLVQVLLGADEVRRTINLTDADGLSAWDHATLAFHRSIWACNAMSLSDPLRWIPRLVVHPYYSSANLDVYRQTQRLLEAAGASMDIERPRQFWLKQCSGQAASTRDRVMASTDLLPTLSDEGLQALNHFLSNIGE